MAHPAKKKAPSPETLDQAKKLAKANQRPGQTKEQTRLIAQGIQKGIEQYKKQQKAKARELDKKLKKASAPQAPEKTIEKAESREIIKYRQHWFPWLLLVVSWAAIGIYLLIP
ncbi:DUF2956 domain-containing protein [Endozoicomonas sp. Mp262]|uniref:DUF2956 domain-containing protein n=1 Tax=Endozoicomonas sp. Mp262 TaxID=2919499 RepID=UPI0021D95454